MACMSRRKGLSVFVFKSFCRVEIRYTHPDGRRYLAFCDEDGKAVATFNFVDTRVWHDGDFEFARKTETYILNPEWPVLTKSAGKRR